MDLENVVHGGGRDEGTWGSKCIRIHTITDLETVRNFTNKSLLVAPFYKLKMFLLRYGKRLSVVS